MQIAIAGAGYVGVSNAMLLSRKHEVVAIDIVSRKMEVFNDRQSPVADAEIQYFLRSKALNFWVALDKRDAYANAAFFIVATPTDFDPRANYFNAESIGAVRTDVVAINPDAVMVVKSAVSVGCIVCACEKFGASNLFFSPEFLSEGRAIYGSPHPVRIIVGEEYDRAKIFAALLTEGAIRKDVPSCSMTGCRGRSNQVVRQHLSGNAGVVLQ